MAGKKNKDLGRGDLVHWLCSWRKICQKTAPDEDCSQSCSEKLFLECNQAYEQMKTLIQQSEKKPERDEKWIEEKAKELCEITYIAEPIHNYAIGLIKAKKFIRQIVAAKLRQGKKE